MTTIIIDASDAILGRVAAYAAKQALLGQTISVINAEKAVVSGAKRSTIEEAKRKAAMGVPRKGPYYSKLPDRYLRRAIRGMLPHKEPRGRAAYHRILCYIGTPTQFKEQKTLRVPGAEASKLPNLKRITVGKICEELGGRQYG
jgi:large subunit ribosomal protein L13